jgi:4-amino-4-deoxy-L-arabinose transferase-like glycosyltransferase
MSATGDEMQHVAAGLDAWHGKFTTWRDERAPHLIVSPPLARLAVAAGPALAGLRLEGVGLRALPYTGAGLATNLALARAGVLPFLALAIVLTWALARRALGDDRRALAAAALFSFCPPVLGHAGLATTDVPYAAMSLVALLAGLRWLEAPTPGRSLALGTALGLATATKLSAPVLGLALVVAALVKRRTAGAAPPRPRGERALHVAVVGAAAALALLAVHRFDFGRPVDGADPAVLRALTDACFSSGAARRAATALAETPMPAPSLFNGLVALCAQNTPGQSTSYLLGRISQDGFPLFFLVALAVKTPLPLLILAGLGVAALLRRARAAPTEPTARPWQLFAIPWMAATFLAVAIPSRINIGVRHLLPVFPLLAILAVEGLASLGRAARRPSLARALAAGLAAWAIVVPFVAAPNYLAWFNALAGRHPEDVLLDSDLDWGQDLGRLERALRERGVQRLSLAYFGPADLARHDLPPGGWLRPHKRAIGWIAISQMYRRGVIGFYYRDGDYRDPSQLVMSAPPDPEQYAWLDAYEPVAHVGQSILLYYVPEGR